MLQCYYVYYFFIIMAVILMYTDVFVLCNSYLGGGNSNIFYFHPELRGRWTHLDEHIFQRGWFNHQLDIVWNYPPPSSSHHQDYYIFSKESL